MDQQRRAAILRDRLVVLVAQAGDDPRTLAGLAGAARRAGLADDAQRLARRALALAPPAGEIWSRANRILSADIPTWHFMIIKDRLRNEAYDAALGRAVRPNSRVLDIGSGTGLLAMMAARAGAGTVVSCEQDPAIAAVATEIVAANGYRDRIRIVAKPSGAVDPESDMGGRADVLVSEIVSNNLLSEGVLPAMEDAVARLVEPGAAIIPSAGRIRIALAHWARLDRSGLGEVAGFDLSPFNQLRQRPHVLSVGDSDLALRSAPADIFAFDFASGGPYRDDRARADLVADGEAFNGVVQWIHLQMDAETMYENRPSHGLKSCWAALFHPVACEMRPPAGATVRVHGSHDRSNVHLWIDPADGAAGVPVIG